MPELPIAGGSYPSRSPVQSNQQAINWYIQPAEGGGLSDLALFGTPGIFEQANTGEIEQINRGSHVMAGIAYFVNGTSLYRVNKIVTAGVVSFTTDVLGSITGSGFVSMADNGTQLMILVPGGDGFIWVEDTTTFTQITDGDFTANGNPQHVKYNDGYFVITTDTKKFIISALNDGLVYDALKFGSAEADPDTIVSLAIYRNQVFIAGSETFEGFQNIGGADFPYQRVTGLVLPPGLFAPYSLVDVAGTFAFIGGGADDRPSVYVFTGNDFQKISADGVDEQLRKATDEQIANAFAVSYSQSGAEFVCFTVASTTFCFNFTSGRWTERSSRVTSGTVINDTEWRVNSLVTAYGRLLVGDSQDGRIGELDLDTESEYGENILRTLVPVPYSNGGKGFTIPSLELTMQSGVGTATNDPQIRLSFARDGRKFKDEISRGIGKIGQFNRRIIWRRNGRFDRFVQLKFEMSGMVRPVILKLDANIIGLDK